MPPLEVAAGVIVGPEGVLLARRPAGAHLAGCWEFPGGKRRPGETVAQALRRELAEELGIRAEVGRLLRVVDHSYPDRGPVRLYFHVCRVAAGRPAALWAAEVRWFPTAALAALEMPPADRPVVELLLRFPRAEDLWDRAGDPLPGAGPTSAGR